MSRTLLNWGVFLLVLGAIPLAVQAGALEAGAAQQLLRLWPLVLIGIGVGLLLRLTPLAALGGVIVAATAGLLVGALLAGGVGGVAGACAGEGTGGEEISQSAGFDAARADIELDLTCVGLTVGRQPGTGWAVEARHAGGRPPTIEATADRLALRTRAEGFVLPLGDVRRDWRVLLPQQTTLSPRLDLNATSAALDLGGGPIDTLGGTLNASDLRLALATSTGLRRVDLTLNASSATLSLPAAGVSADVALNASSIALCVPAEAPMLVHFDDTLSSHNFDEAGLVPDTDSWETPDDGSAGYLIELAISANISAVTVDRSGGCE